MSKIKATQFRGLSVNVANALKLETQSDFSMHVGDDGAQHNVQHQGGMIDADMAAVPRRVLRSEAACRSFVFSMTKAGASNMFNVFNVHP